MTRIGIRAGHTERSCGSSGILNENKEAREVKKYVLEYLSKYAEVVDLQPPEDMAYPEELNYSINLANSSKLDFGFSIHFNNAYETYNGALGTETIIYPGSKAFGSAKGIVDKLSALGFKNRGVQYRKDLGETRCITSPWIIIEVCFVEATKDAEIYNNIGAYKVAKSIVEGIIGQTIDETPIVKDKGYVVTNYLPQAYSGYDGINITEILSKYFSGIKTYIKHNSKGIWIETEYLSMNQCKFLKVSLGDLFYSIE